MALERTTRCQLTASRGGEALVSAGRQRGVEENRNTRFDRQTVGTSLSLPTNFISKKLLWAPVLSRHRRNGAPVLASGHPVTIGYVGGESHNAGDLAQAVRMGPQLECSLVHPETFNFMLAVLPRWKFLCGAG